MRCSHRVWRTSSTRPRPTNSSSLWQRTPMRTDQFGFFRRDGPECGPSSGPRMIASITRTLARRISSTPPAASNSSSSLPMTGWRATTSAPLSGSAAYEPLSGLPRNDAQRFRTRVRRTSSTLPRASSSSGSCPATAQRRRPVRYVGRHQRTRAIVDAYRNDVNGRSSGSAYIFDTTTGQQIGAPLQPDNASPNSEFGYSVSISGPGRSWAPGGTTTTGPTRGRRTSLM